LPTGSSEAPVPNGVRVTNYKYTRALGVWGMAVEKSKFNIKICAFWNARGNPLSSCSIKVRKLTK